MLNATTSRPLENERRDPAHGWSNGPFVNCLFREEDKFLGDSSTVYGLCLMSDRSQSLCISNGAMKQMIPLAWSYTGLAVTLTIRGLTATKRGKVVVRWHALKFHYVMLWHDFKASPPSARS